MRGITRETIIDRRQPPGIRWGAVFAGGFVAVAVWVLLQTFDVGAVLASYGTTRAGSFSGISASAWTLVTPIIALFFGGLVGARLGAARDAGTGAMHGLVVWALAMVAGAVALVWGLGVVAASAVHAGGLTITTNTNGATANQAQIEAARAAGQALLWGGLAMLVGLIASVIGGIAGVHRGTRLPARDVDEVPPPAPPLATPPPPVPPAAA